MAKAAGGKKKARVFYEQCIDAARMLFVKVGRPPNKTKRLAK